MKIGLALGSGSARGWAHIGIIRALGEMGVRPDIVTGCSIGALVGSAYVSGHLDELQRWVERLGMWDVVRLLDVRLNGGLIEGENLMGSFADKIGDTNIEELATPFACIATDLKHGREVWLQHGPLREAVRASIALPGLFSPARFQGQWLVDGGLTNPVPVSLCRAMGAEVIIAVNLNADIVGRHLTGIATGEEPPPEQRDLFNLLLERLTPDGRKRGEGRKEVARRQVAESPGLFEVMASSINIMQDRITRSRMAGDPPDVVLDPRLGHLGLLEFDRAVEAIEEGYATVRRLRHQIEFALGRPGGPHPG